MTKAMTTQEVFQNFITPEQMQQYGLAYVQIYNMARAVAKQEKKNIFQCSKKGKQDMARASMKELVTITPFDPKCNIASAKMVDYVVNVIKEKDKRIVLLPKIITMMIDEIINYFDEMYKTTQNKSYLECKNGATIQKEMWEGMLELRHTEISM